MARPSPWRTYGPITVPEEGHRDDATRREPVRAAQRSLAQSLARKYGKHGVHVALIIVDGMVDLPNTRKRMPDAPDEAFVSPDGFADAVSFLLHQRRGAWTFELDIRPHVENW